jgi:hypothetical protein
MRFSNRNRSPRTIDLAPRYELGLICLRNNHEHEASSGCTASSRWSLYTSHRIWPLPSIIRKSARRI